MISCEKLRLNQIGYVILFVGDLVRSLEFYRDLLGMTVRKKSPGWIEFDGGGVTLALHGSDDIPMLRGNAIPKIVFHVDNVQQTYSELKSRGVKFFHEPTKVHESPGLIGYAAEFRDYDKNILSIYGTVTRTLRPI